MIEPRTHDPVPMSATGATSATFTERGAGITVWLLVAVLCTAQFVVVLGTAFLIVALPSIQDDMRLSDGATDLLAGIFALCFGALLILGGKLADALGARRLVVAGFGLFVVASCLGGLAPNSLLLFAGRSGQGIAAALAVPAALALLAALFRSGSDRNRVLGVWTAAGAAGGAAGFAAGGVVTDGLGWHWIFLLNVPVLLVALGFVLRLAPPDGPKAELQAVDGRGAVLLTAGLLALMLGLSRLRNSAGSIELVANLGVLIGGIVLLVTFGLVERADRDPSIPTRLLRLRSLVGASLVAGALTFTTTAASVILTMFLQRVLEVEPTRSGLLLLPGNVAIVAGSFAGARLSSVRGFGLPMVIGLSAIASSTLPFVVGMGDASLTWIAAGFVLSGLGLGCASVASTACGLSRIGETDEGMASGLVTSAAMLGTATGIVTLSAIAALRTSGLGSGPDPAGEALTAGYQLAIIVAGVVAVALVPVAAWSTKRTPADAN